MKADLFAANAISVIHIAVGIILVWLPSHINSTHTKDHQSVLRELEPYLLGVIFGGAISLLLGFWIVVKHFYLENFKSRSSHLPQWIFVCDWILFLLQLLLLGSILLFCCPRMYRIAASSLPERVNLRVRLDSSCLWLMFFTFLGVVSEVWYQASDIRFSGLKIGRTARRTDRVDPQALHF